MTRVREIPGHKGYFVSDCGQVFGRYGRKKLVPDTQGYLKVWVGGSRTGSKKECKRVHQLVLEAFTDKPSPEYEVAHNNSDKTDNRLQNLRWATHQENMDDRSRANSYVGSRAYNSKFSDDQVKQIRSRYSCGDGDTYTIAAEYGVSQSVIWRIVTRRGYRNVE